MTEPRTRLGDEADAVRKVRNEIQLRKLNERIEDHHLRVQPTVADWVCECADENCAQPIRMSIAEYEAVRVEPTHFFIAHSEEHLSPDIEYVAASGACSIAGTMVSMNSGTGTCTLTASQAGDSNYSAATDVIRTVAASKADAIITVNGHSGVYDGNPHGATGTAVGIEEIAADLNALLHLGASFTNVPGRTANWTFDGDGNYNPANGTAPIVIGKADPTIVVDGYTGVYDGDPHGATGSATGVKSEALTGLTLGVTYTSVPGGTANWTFTDVTGNYNDKSGTAAIVITRKGASVTANAKTKIYGAVNPALDAAVAGTVAGDSLNYSLATTAVQLSNVGSYAITVTLGANPNYEVTPTNAALSITPKAASVTANNKSKVYGEANPALDATVSGTVAGGDALNYTLATPATTTSGIGGYPIDVTLGANPNYAVTPTSGTLTVNAKALTITAKDATKILGATVTFTGTEFTSSGLVNGDTVASVTLTSTGAATGAAIGSYPIVPSAAVGTTIGNYAITYKNGTLKVQYLWDGFLQPINDTAHDAHQTAPYSSFKAGQTIPAKFELKNAGGQIVTQVGNPVFNRTGNLGACSAIAGLEPDDLAVAPDTDGVYKATGSQYNYGWSTKGLTQGLYMIFANLADGTSRSVYICLTK